MSNPNPIADVRTMLAHYGFKTQDLTSERLDFRLSLLAEEYQELQTARDSANAEEMVDALIDLTVIAFGTLELAGVDIDTAWSRVHHANMQKYRGTKPGRPSDGWDLAKPPGWQPPTHQDNLGVLPTLLTEKTQ